MKTLLRLMVAAVLVPLFLMGASSLMAASPAGASRVDGLAPNPTYQSLAPGASAWLKIPYRFNYRLQFDLDAFGVGGFKFDVYASDTAASPVGIGSYDQNEPMHDLNWEGRLEQDGFYYVLVTNTNPYAAAYLFSVNEKQPYYSPPSTYVDVGPGCGVFDKFAQSSSCPPPDTCGGSSGWQWNSELSRWSCIR